jgi:glucosamine-6-phosphate deaminase
MAKFNYNLAEFLPFKDKAVCERVRAIKRADVCKHPNKNFRIDVIEQDDAFGFAYLLDIVTGIKRSLDEGKKSYVMILPATNPYYAWAAEMINRLRIPCKHVHTFNMDEYADENGRTAPADWRGGFQYYMWKDFFGRIDPKLRMPEKQIHFPLTENVNHYSRMIEDLGGADVCYGGIGWSGHIAFFEPHLGVEFGDDIKAYLQAGARIVDLHPITICQNVLFPDAGSSGDWSWHPPKAATIGPRELAGSKRVSFWDSLRFGDAVWQSFITRLAAHGPVTPMVPASILQILRSELILSGAVAADITDESGARSMPFKFPKR